MYEQSFANMIMRTNLLFSDGKIAYPPQKPAHSIMDIEPNVPENGGFIFYDRSDPKQQICKISYTEVRERPELVYETEPAYRGKGYMKKAMLFTLNWISEHGVGGPLWLLIGNINTPSQRIAKYCNFVKKDEPTTHNAWYCLEKIDKNNYKEKHHG